MDPLETLNLAVALASIAIGMAMIGLVIARGGKGITLGLVFGSILILYGFIRIRFRGR